ncbi:MULTISPECIES: lysozyme-like domain containing protein [unclassified Halomonas]|uniref:transglycosylase SLT domain-containing protein n=1 Tax=unclassified Halomonas TaxID=2609666 RepID=UPI001EF4DDB2|nr:MULTISPECIES: lysozyme-like domain containing protein [unclassified Halomonas]MCG7578431.1 lysozyme-like domain containing protein [Halomonas sp. MMH1-48]MCG7605536.1 lysozyme-like domain containing protein [Halomonas sp. MM17-34]MCG7614726.1 lysozyme-like domain containing protein [Halomonas sp. MM17-29]MCG7621602.1 lysozyme-like domain containing protein [Halomonas sp. DSH1-27]
MYRPVDSFWVSAFSAASSTASLSGWLAVAAMLLLSGCATFAPSPPEDQTNICEIFREQPSWYDYAKESEEKWGTPIATQMAFIQRESSFRSHVRPDRKYYLGFIPGPRPSSAKGYAQAQDPVWGEYEDQAGSLFARRTHMKHATDFIGWYNARTRAQTGISLNNPEHLYYAYHEGAGGYQRGSYRSKPQVLNAGRQVASLSNRYQAQLNSCQAEFQCRKFYQVWPFCRS